MFDDVHQGRPQWNFDSFPIAMLTTFQVMTYDMWIFVMMDSMRAVGWWGSLYYFSWIAIGALVLRNLLLVIILDTYVLVHGEVLREENVAAQKLKYLSELTVVRKMPMQSRSRLVERMTERSVSAGEHIIQAGNDGREIYFVLSGA